MGEVTPFQEAKKRRKPYVKLVIDERHRDTGHGKIGVEGPVSAALAKRARRLWAAIVEEAKEAPDG